tara:strand:+ start:242 stop:463 length:222 start_codon:yes stop_codon:yes gene_type:complete
VDNVFKNYLKIMEKNNITGTNFKLADFRGTIQKIVKPPSLKNSDVWCRSPKNQDHFKTFQKNYKDINGFEHIA